MKKKIEDLYDIDKAELERQRECNRLEKILVAENDRGAAILGAAYIEKRLHEIVINYLRDSNITKDFLNRQSFESLTSLSYILGLINKDEFKGINQVRFIRNKFAHDFIKDLSFDDQLIKTLCGNLLYTDNFLVSGKKVKTNRDRFICSVFILGRSLLFRVRPDEKLEFLNK